MARIVLFAAPLLLCGCGYVGEPLYPALNIPSRVIDLSVVERGDRLDVYFTVPDLTTEGLAVKSIGAVDLRVGPPPGSNFSSEQWADAAMKIAVPPPPKPQAVKASIPARDYAGKEVIVAVRLANAKGRFSEWSNRATLKVAPPVEAPANFTATASPEGVLLKWNATAAGLRFRVFRGSGKEPQPALLDTTGEHSYVDATASYGVRYEYFVQAQAADVESEAVGPVAITPKDIFPPAVPAGLAATIGLKTVELAWERNTESDFKAYRVYRALENGPFELLAEEVASPNFSDRSAQSGKKYRYAITALDQLGNESAKCPPVEISAP